VIGKIFAGCGAVIRASMNKQGDQNNDRDGNPQKQ
jgi:hypothetical protein